MSLALSKLEKVRELASGVVQAQCPACAEGGHDRAGEHLRIYPDGRFGCCVFPKDHEHRKRIFALAGDRSPRSFKVKVPGTRAASATSQSVTDSLRTLRTACVESDLFESEMQNNFRTDRTTFSNPRAHRREQDLHDAHTHTCKDNDSSVLSVSSGDGVSNPPTRGKLPYFTPGGTLVIPFDSPERYHWWRGGQSVKETIAEILERKENDASPF